MPRKPKILLSIFLLLSAVHLFSLFTGPAMLRFLTKPLLVSTLAFYFFLETREYSGRLRRSFLAGLVFSVLGDSWLLLEGEVPFLFGLGSFLLAQLCYLTAFLSYRPEVTGYLKRCPWSALPLLFYLAALMIYLWPGVPGALRLPVLIYGLAITGMAAACLNLRDKLPGKTFRRLFSGSLLFLLSDSLIALSRFVVRDPDAPIFSLLIMASYLAAQYLIGTTAVAMTETDTRTGQRVS